ncbi:MAG TPA: SPFH domain-containing protein [Candidatus Acidoferrales bacterium]|nr:SPFH domain-containing protein [Candidatus Acidoferrales bacterium]
MNMIFLRHLLIAAGIGLLFVAGSIAGYDLIYFYELDRLVRRIFSKNPPDEIAKPRRIISIRWHDGGKIAAAAIIALLIALSIVVIPDGAAGVRVSQISGIRPGTLYAGVHLVVPLIERVSVYDIREQVFATAAQDGEKPHETVLKVEAREGLPLGLSVLVDYRLDASRLAYVEANLPQPIGEEIVGPVVESAFREVAPDYVVRDVFSVKRDEFRQRVAGLITARLAQDAIVVKEVLVRRIVLPPEYAQGLENILLKEQQSDQMNFEQEIEQKRVKIAEYQADENKIRQVKQAEASAQARVIAAKAESDAMQYTLPLKQKQIEQARLEAKARKEATIENAEADAQAKVIDSHAEQQRQQLLAAADANRIRITGAAEAQRMQLEAAALRGNPLLIQKIVAEKLSDKVRIMMVPMDGKFFFTNGVLDAPMGAADPPPSGRNGDGPGGQTSTPSNGRP